MSAAGSVDHRNKFGKYQKHIHGYQTINGRQDLSARITIRLAQAYNLTTPDELRFVIRFTLSAIHRVDEVTEHEHPKGYNQYDSLRLYYLEMALVELAETYFRPGDKATDEAVRLYVDRALSVSETLYDIQRDDYGESMYPLCDAPPDPRYIIEKRRITGDFEWDLSGMGGQYFYRDIALFPYESHPDELKDIELKRQIADEMELPRVHLRFSDGTDLEWALCSTPAVANAFFEKLHHQ